MFYRYISLILILLHTNIYAQIKCDIYSWDKQDNTYTLEAQQKDFKTYLDSLNKAGYYALEVDSIHYQVARCHAYINRGNKYTTFMIEGKDYKQLEQVKDSLVQEGQVFSKIILSPSGFQDNKALYKLSIEESEARTLDDIVFVGYSNIPEGFKQSLLEKEKKKATAASIQEIEQKLEQHKGITLTQPSKISYTKDSTLLYVYTQKQKQNYFDGIIGFGTDNNNKIKLNGNVQLSLVNTLNKLEEINLQWMGSENQSQNLDLDLRFPYVFFNALGVQTDLHIRKQDSTYLQLRWNNGITYQINQASYILGSYSYETSNYINNNQNTQSGDYSKNGFGVGYFYLDDNPLLLDKNKLGLAIQSNLLKKSFEEEKTTQTEIAYTLYKQQRIWKNHYLFGQLQGENLIEKEKDFLLNELYQLGGMNNLRGFNQNSIFTSSYNMGTLAYRYIPNNAFLIELFSDFALTKPAEDQDLNYFMGFGTGIQFRVKFGVFKLMYALGKEENHSLDFSNGKVHFGIKSIF